ncbi:MAG: hypothetical protein ACFCVC_03005 [Acidimicrobiia bacterium]
MTVEVPEDLIERLAAEAARRGVSVDQVTVEALQAHFGAAQPVGDEAGTLAAFVGSFDSGDPEWASTDTHSLRAAALARRPA